MTATTELQKLPDSADQNSWSPEQTALMQFANAANAPASVAQAFLHACARTGLDPIAKQIYAMNFNGKWAVIVGVDGFRVIAQRSKGYQGQVGPQFTADGVTWTDAWLPKTPGEKPAAARVGVWREGFREPLWQVVTWQEFGKTTGNWRDTPAHMLGIRAETHALRRAFPNDLSGLYTAEDFESGEADVVEQTRDWKGAIDEADDKRILAELLVEMKNAGDWTQELNAYLVARAGVVTKDTRPAKPAEPQEVVYEEDGTPAETDPADAPADVPDVDGQSEPEPAPMPETGAQGVMPGEAYARWQAEQAAKQ